MCIFSHLFCIDHGGPFNLQIQGVSLAWKISYIVRINIVSPSSFYPSVLPVTHIESAYSLTDFTFSPDFYLLGLMFVWVKCFIHLNSLDEFKHQQRSFFPAVFFSLEKS